MSAIVSTHFNQEQLALVKSHLMVPGKDGPAPTDNDIRLFGMVCSQLGLDPFAKQIFAIQRKGKWTFQPSVDGLRAIASRTGAYAGSDEPLFDEGLTIFEFEQTKRKNPVVCKVVVYKIVSGIRCPFVGIAKFDESVQCFWDDKTKQQKPSETWAKMPLSMLAKCAESQALRKAFPQCQAIEQSIQTIEDDSWRIAGYEWGISQGVAPNLAKEIMELATSKENLYQRMKLSIPIDVTPISQ